jgi:hypothetical protein
LFNEVGGKLRLAAAVEQAGQIGPETRVFRIE